MEISDELKNNLIADVENILEVTLTPNEDAMLARCFEITIGNAITELQVSEKKTAHIFLFIEWCVINCYKIYDGNWYGVCDEDITFETIEELYKFWYDNVLSITKKG